MHSTSCKVDAAVESAENAVIAICQAIISVSYSNGIRKFRLLPGASRLNTEKHDSGMEHV
jgi:hypothetical protein